MKNSSENGRNARVPETGVRWPRDLVWGIVLASAYVALGKFGLGVHAVNVFATFVWAPSGIALAALLIRGVRLWPAIFAGAFLVNVWTGAPPAVALCIAAGNTLEAVAAAWALRRMTDFRSSLDRLSDVLRLAGVGALLATMISATVGTSSLIVGGLVPPDRIGATWAAWWLGDAVGILVVSPVLLTWMRPRGFRIQDAGRFAESLALSLLVAATAVSVFENGHVAVASLLAPLLVWAALRFEQRGAARAAFVVCAVAVFSLARGRGPFEEPPSPEALFALQSFLGLTAATFLVLGTVTSERRLAEERSKADIRDLKIAEEELRSAKEDSEAANRAKDEFLAALSHELRTPLTPVLALASVVERDPDLPDRFRRQIEVVRRNAELEARLIDDLLDLTRIARGKLEIEPEPVLLGEALDHVVEICRPEADTKKLVLQREDAGPDVYVMADPARLRQILWNLVRNAVKFTPSGGRIVVRTVLCEGNRIAVEVSDSGIGIASEEIARIFRPFEQAGPRHGGLGLGLAISHALVGAHGGTLSASSGGPGQGATFRVELATLAVGTRRRQAAPFSASGATVPGLRRVLFVEDHADTLEAARELLAELSCDVVCASSIEEALAAAEIHTFDLVLSDLGLPDGNGLDLMRRLRDRHGLAGIALTGYGMEEDLKRSREAGFLEHLVKPITFQRLEAAVERFFRSRRDT